MSCLDMLVERPDRIAYIVGQLAHLKASRRKDLGLLFPGWGRGVTDPAHERSMRRSFLPLQ